MTKKNFIDPNKTTIDNAGTQYINSIKLGRSENTTRTYQNGMNIFLAVLNKNGLEPKKTSVAELPEDAIVWLATALKNYAPTTERLYLTAITGFYNYLEAEELAPINLSRVRHLIRQRARRPGKRLPQFPRNAIETTIQYATNLINQPCENASERLRNLRDRAFLITLADTGLRVHEACGMRRGDLDWNEGRALIIGKGNRQAVARFSRRAQAAIKDYLDNRASIDGISGKPLSSLPLFARHDRGAGKKVKPISTGTGRNIITEIVKNALGTDFVGKITPHSFRHYFVTKVLHASGNLKLAQELARHRNIAVTQRYAHLSDIELDKGYWEIFEE